MNSLKIGDRVKIISLREVLPFGFIDPMKKYCGKITRIKQAYGERYSLEIEDGQYNWSDEMFEMVVNGLLRNE